MAKTNKAQNVEALQVSEEEILRNAETTVKPYLAALRKVSKAIEREARKELSASIELGQKLAEVQGTFKRGTFFPWAEELTGYARSTIKLYLSMAKHADKLANCESVSEARKVMKGAPAEDSAQGNGNEKPAKLTDDKRIAKIIAEIAKLDDPAAAFDKIMGAFADFGEVREEVA